MNENQEKSKILVGLAELYNYEFSKMSLALYLSALEDVGVERLRTIVKLGIRDWKFFPKPVEIVQFGRMDVEEDRKFRAVSAFKSIIEGIKYPSRKAPLDEAAKKALYLIGGVQAVGMAPEEELQWLEKRFVENYELADAYKKSEDVIGELPAGCEKVPELTGFVANLGNSLSTERAFEK